MRIPTKVNLILLTLLGVSSGIAKIMRLPDEVAFFQGVGGFSEIVLVLYGVAQLVGGALLVFKKTRTMGATTMVVTFSISTILIFVTGKVAFGLFSILPIVMAGIVIMQSTGSEK